MKKISMSQKLLAAFLVFAFIFSLAIGIVSVKPLNAFADTQESNSISLYSSEPEYLQLELIGEGSDYWLVRVTNPTSKSIKVTYNEFMCYENDAKNWEKLGHLRTITLGTSENTASTYSKTQDVKIYNFPLSTGYIPFSYVSDNVRIITSAYNLNGSKLDLDLSYTTVIHYSACLEILTTKYENSTWTVRVKNPTLEPVDFYYNTKMCNKSDAENWSGLKDINTENDRKAIKLGALASTTVTIKENWFATTIAFSYIDGGNRYITYAYDLNKTVVSIMTVKTKVIPAKI